MEHPGARDPRPHAPVSGPHPKPLGVLERVDLSTEPHDAHFAAVPMPVRRDRGKVTVEVQVIDQQTLDSRVRVPFAQAITDQRRPRLV